MNLPEETSVLRGSIKFFDLQKGYGFIAVDNTGGGKGSPDVFVHAKELQESGVNPNHLPPGRRVSFKLQKSSRGKDKRHAVQIKLEDGNGSEASDALR